MLNDLIRSFVTFFAVIDPIGTIPVFIAVTASFNESRRKTIATRAALTAAGVLLFVIIVGELILNAIDIPLPAFQIAGGIVLFLFALTMILGESKPDSELSQIKSSKDTAIFPLAMPSLASPGAILAAILLTENSKFDAFEQAATAGTMLAVILIAWIMMLAASWLFKFIGKGGAAIISRVMGLILSAVAVKNVLLGIKLYFNL